MATYYEIRWRNPETKKVIWGDSFRYRNVAEQALQDQAYDEPEILHWLLRCSDPVNEIVLFAKGDRAWMPGEEAVDCYDGVCRVEEGEVEK